MWKGVCESISLLEVGKGGLMGLEVGGGYATLYLPILGDCFTSRSRSPTMVLCFGAFWGNVGL